MVAQKVFIRIPVSAAVWILAACSGTPVPELPSSDVPAAWENSSAESVQTWPTTDWWTAFNDAGLNDMVAQLEARNLDLVTNRATLLQARLVLREAGFDLFPSPAVSLGADWNYSGTEPDGGNYEDHSTSSADLSLGVIYSDILAKPTEYSIAKAEYLASVANAVETRLNTLATAASTYFQVLLLRDRIRTAESNVANAEAIARIAETRSAVGVITALDALQQRIAVDNEKANLRSLRQSEYAATAALALVLAESVQDIDIAVTTLEGVAVPRVAPGLTSDLLVRRPDIVRARAELVQSAKGIDLARLEFLPVINLTGSASLISGSLRNLLDSADLFVNASAGIVQTLLDNGSRSRNLKRARLSLESALANYRKTAIAAFNEIEVSLSNIETLQELGDVAARNLSVAEEAFRIAEVQFREGAVDYQNVLVAQTTLFDSRNAYLDNKLTRLNAIIALYVALGGGWQLGSEAVS